MTNQLLNKILKQSFAILIVGCFITSAHAQKITSIDYEELIHEVICDFTEYSLKRQNDQKILSEFKAETSDGRCDYFTIRPFLRTKKDKNSKDVEEIISILFEGYGPSLYQTKSSNQGLYDGLMDFFEEQSVQNFAVANANSYPGFKTDLEGYIRNTLNLDYEPAVDTTIILDENPIIADDEADLEEKIKDNRNPLNTTKGANSLLFWGFLLLFLAIIAYLLYDYWRRNPSAFKTPKWMSYSSSTKDKYQDQIDDLSSKMQEHAMRMDEQQSEIQAISQSLDYLARKIELLDAPTSFQEEAEVVIPEDIPTFENITNGGDIDNDIIPDDIPTEDHKVGFSDEIPDLNELMKNSFKPEMFFMPVPNSDATFDLEYRQENFVDTESVYRFETISANEAKFSFYNDAGTVRRALSGYDVYLKPVCKALSEFNINATRIVTQVPGKVEKVGNQWKLKEKALIYYE